MRQHAPRLKQAYALREQLTAIFEQAPSKPVAERKIRAWMRRVRQSGLQCFDAFLQTLEHRWEEITNYFVDRASSGFVEGLNNKLKVLKRHSISRTRFPTNLFDPPCFRNQKTVNCV